MAKAKSASGSRCARRSRERARLRTSSGVPSLIAQQWASKPASPSARTSLRHLASTATCSPGMSNAFSSRASRRCRSSKNGHPRKEASVTPPLVALEAGLLLRDEGLVGAREVLGLHADRLRLGLGL